MIPVVPVPFSGKEVVMAYERVYRMNLIMRINHWLMFIAFLACAITGFYIAHPFLVFETGEIKGIIS